MTKPHSLCALVLLLISLLLLTSCRHEEDSMTNAPLTADSASPAMMHLLNPDTEVRGVWIASVYNIDYPASPELSADELRAGLDDILDTCAETGLNTIFFQVRPCCDALYKSEIFPVSRYLSADGSLPFDPLEYLTDAAHHRNIFVYAWINPLRVTVSETDVLSENSPAAVFPEWTVNYGGKLYLNPGLPEVHQLVADGIEEIVENYPVDGVVFDDYFYPYTAYDANGMPLEFDDDAAYQQYGSDFQNRADWRRSNVNDLVRLCWYTVHAADPDCKFGVSPSGVWRNNDGKNGGSDTRGYEAYVSGYCDALAWVKEGTVDFLSPQLYWDFDTAVTPFDVLTRWWNTQLEGTGVQLWISHGSYRYEEGEWTNPEGQLTEQIAFARAEHSYRGSVCYGYDEIHRNIRGAADDLRSAYRDEIIYTDIISNGLPVSVSSPADGSILYEAQTYIVGMSDPYIPLTMNGEKVGRTKSGCFSLYVTLEPGENRFVFEQNGVETVLTLHFGDSHLNQTPDEPETPEPSAGPVIPTLETLSVADPYPVGQVSTREGILWVTCTAPYGAKVTAEIGGVTTELVPMEAPAAETVENGYPAVTYGKNALLPDVGADEILDCGNMTFHASFPDSPEEEATLEGCPVRVLGEEAAICVRAAHDYTNLKITENSSYYNDYTVQSEGMTEYAIHQRNGFYLLRMGGYLSEADAEEVTDPADQPEKVPEIRSAQLADCGRTTELRLRCAGKPACNGTLDGNGSFVLTLYNVKCSSDVLPAVEDNPLFDSCEVSLAGEAYGKINLFLKLKAAENFYGFDLEYEEDGVIVRFRNPIAVNLSAEKPLAGVTIVLDAGHGGWENGAVGPLPGWNEKDVNLSVVREAAVRLESLGAEVLLTREGDDTVDLYARMDFLEETEPDLCVSIHQNSMGFSSDVTRIRGTLALWTTEAGSLLSDCVGRAVADSLGRLYRGSQYQALAVCRNPKFPSALIEAGFMTSVEEYELAVSERGICQAADGVVNGILHYFEKMTEYAEQGR